MEVDEIMRVAGRVHAVVMPRRPLTLLYIMQWGELNTHGQGDGAKPEVAVSYPVGAQHLRLHPFATVRCLMIKDAVNRQHGEPDEVVGLGIVFIFFKSKVEIPVYVRLIRFPGLERDERGARRFPLLFNELRGTVIMPQKV